MKISLALVAEIKSGELTLLAYNAVWDNNIFFDKSIDSSICKSIIDSFQAQHINRLQQSNQSASLEAQAGLKCFYGTPVIDEKGNVFAVLCAYSREVSIIPEDKLLHIERIKMLIEEDILYSNNELLKPSVLPVSLPSDDQKLKHFLRFSPLGIFYYDHNLIITDLNDKFAEILRSSINVLLGLNMHTINDKRVIPSLQNALLGIEGEYEGEYCATANNTTLTVLLKTAPVYVKNKIIGGIGVLQDISIKTNIAKALAISETKYRELVEKINDVIFSIDTAGVFTYVSPVVKLLTGYSPDEIIGYEATDFIHAQDCGIYRAAIKEVEGGSTVQSEIKIKNKDGQYRWIRNSLRPIYNNNGSFAGIHGIAQDIEHTKLAEIYLRKSEDKYKRLAKRLKATNQQLKENIAKTNTLLSVIPDMMLVFDREGFITDYHSNSDKGLYKEALAFLNDHIVDVLPEDIVELTLEKIKLVLAKKEVQTYRYSLNINGEVQTFESRMVYYNRNHTLAIVRNVTANEQAEKELIAAKEKAEESDHLKSSFLANMSHEIRTPMNGIIGFSELLSSRTVNPAEREYYTSIIINSGHQLLGIINDVLEISKIETGQISINKTNTDINYMMDLLLYFFKKKADDKDLQLSTHKACKRDTLYVLTDENKLRQVFNNLISNAIKFTPSGRVIFGYRFADDDHLEFCVEDEGIGIADDEQDKIFNRFTQANANIMSKHGGTGLGLSISKSLVELLGGRIWVESELGKGSKFYFSLPYKKEG